MSNKKHTFMGFLFSYTIVMGIVCGYFLYGSRSHILSTFLCFVLSAFAMFVGMVLAFLHSDEREMNKRKAFMLELEESLKARVNEAVTEDRKIYGAMSVEMAKAVADRVANKIVGKHVEGMSDNDVRASVLDSVNKIVEEEIGILHKAMKNEAVKMS
jgi:hypothetical protein